MFFSSCNKFQKGQQAHSTADDEILKDSGAIEIHGAENEIIAGGADGVRGMYSEYFTWLHSSVFFATIPIFPFQPV